MTVVTEAVVLARSNHRETDRLCVLYTRDFGKLTARFSGVNRPAGKLKALTEPMVRAEYRLQLREGAAAGVATGGRLLSVHPGIRRGFDATLRALELCEMLDRITPPLQPSLVKFGLLGDCLEALDCGARSAAWVPIAFGLRLLEAAGYGLSGARVSEANRGVWEALHSARISDVAGLPEDRERQGRLESLLRATFERLSERPLKAAGLADRFPLPAAA